jgi:crotonobetaine/carnitine-CoA ligase
MLTYPHFVPHFPQAQWTLPQVLEHQARTIGDRPFLQWTENGDAMSFAAVNRQVNRLAHGLRQIGVSHGDRIVLFMPNCLELIFVWFAANKLGAVEVPINTAYRGSFLEHQVNICEAEIIVTSPDLVAHVIASLPRMPAIKRVIVRSENEPSSSQSGAEISALRAIYADDESDPDIAVSPQDTAAILFTSGTTGLSKGVQMPHAQVYLFAEESVQVGKLTDGDVYMTGFPLFHANAQFVTLYASLIAGIRCVLLEKFSASQWVDQLHATGATITNSLGAVLPFVHSQPPSERDRSHRLTRIFAAPVPHDMLDALEARFGVSRYVTTYGMTECCMPFMTLGDVELPRGACGVLVDQWFEARLVDPETDLEVADGELGELILRPRAPWTMNSGYVNMADNTLDAWRNLWFHTGDAMRRDAAGWFYFVDRFKDALRRRGENISSFEVEEPLRTHPAVAEVAVIGVPADEMAGEEEVKACVVLNAGQSLAETELIDWCLERMPRFLVPRYIQFVETLPKTPTERVQKAELRKQHASTAGWDRIAAGYP